MYYRTNWWTCPKCKNSKILSDEKVKCIRCSSCGRFFDSNGKELSVNVSLYDLQPDDQCDMS